MNTTATKTQTKTYSVGTDAGTWYTGKTAEELPLVIGFLTRTLRTDRIIVTVER